MNVKAAINVSQLVAQGMKERGLGGSIVNVSSQAGVAALKSEWLVMREMLSTQAFSRYLYSHN